MPSAYLQISVLGTSTATTPNLLRLTDGWDHSPWLRVRRRFRQALRAVSGHTRFMLRTPVAKCAKQRPESLAVLSKRILDAQRHFVKNLATNDSIALQLAQMLRQHFARNRGNEPLQFQKSARTAFPKVPEDKRFPLSTNDTKSCLDRTVTELSYFRQTALQKKCLVARRL